MADKVLENNQVSIVGEIVSEFTFSHEVYGEGFYTVDVAVSRLSNYADYIPLMVSERLIDTSQSYVGEKVYVTGQFRSYNRHEETRNRLILSVFVREIQFVDDMWEEDAADLPSNLIILDGYVCKPAGLPEDASGQRDRGSSGGSEPGLREIGLHSLYLLGEKRQIRHDL